MDFLFGLIFKDTRKFVESAKCKRDTVENCRRLVIGKKILRKGPTKMLCGICTAMKLLSEKVSLPMFLGTSTMVSQTPLAQLAEGDNSEVNAKFKERRISLNSLVTALATKNVSDQEVPAPSKGNTADSSKAVQNQIVCSN